MFGGLREKRFIFCNICHDQPRAVFLKMNLCCVLTKERNRIRINEKKE